ncbi:hypothetical protein SAMN05421812_101634 [Asanoa hainanensis]|uniref:Uncharacterized protein n=1 Tax=Asanoa hainanensis TaxID=560556 RepID=A0A239GZX9_9ACTN|nr:hypothetical protein [Asanoa hainanensis]SNS74697.1 hypothetical protein SAMN05421812_101634 [Asanoa hainanensis]
MRLRGWIAPVMVGVAVAAGMAIASPASAAGGGCFTAVRSGWNIGVCSSDNGSSVFGDIYINSRGTFSSCSVSYKLVTSNSGTLLKQRGNHSCTTGHHSAISAAMPAGGAITVMTLTVNGNSTYLTGSSPRAY